MTLLLVFLFFIVASGVLLAFVIHACSEVESDADYQARLRSEHATCDLCGAKYDKAN